MGFIRTQEQIEADEPYVPITQYEQTTPSLTKQSFKDECDINQIVAKFEKTGLVNHLARGVPQFADVSEMGD